MSKSNIEIPDGFNKIMKDFVNDILTTFPEYEEGLDEGLRDILADKYDTDSVQGLFLYVKDIYPKRFFDILYQNEEMYSTEVDTHFLPNIDFAHLFAQNISDQTKTIIWKYLQLVLFSVINTEEDSQSFGDTAKLFEAINEDELKKKLEETMEQMANIFDMDGSSNTFSRDTSEADAEILPDPEELHDHISSLLQGNLGKLAAEITEETMKELNTDISGVNSVGDVFQSLFKNPGKLVKMIKKVGTKLDNKLKSGELKESELMKEAIDLMGKMETMPGMKNMKSMLSQLGMTNTQGSSKMNVGATKSRLQQNLRHAQRKERMLQKLERRKQNKRDEQIKILEQQLAAARAANSNTVSTAPAQPELSKKAKRRRKKRNRKNKK